MLRVIETDDRNQQWLGVADIMRAEATKRPMPSLDRYAGRANGVAAITPERTIREGDTYGGNSRPDRRGRGYRGADPRCRRAARKGPARSSQARQDRGRISDPARASCRGTSATKNWTLCREGRPRVLEEACTALDAGRMPFPKRTRANAGISRHRLDHRDRRMLGRQRPVEAQAGAARTARHIRRAYVRARR